MRIFLGIIDYLSLNLLLVYNCPQNFNKDIFYFLLIIKKIVKKILRIQKFYIMLYKNIIKLLLLL